MDRYEALYKFWNQFGIPAYREPIVPDRDDIEYPYITYQSAAAGFGDIVPLTASIWDRDMSPATVDNLADRIEHHIRTKNPLEYDGGMLRPFIGETTFAQDMEEPDDDMIRHKILNVNFEFMQIRI